ncbi:MULTISPECIES: cupin domain-containing protein [Dethiosulfovibrio]|uniref:Cupin domain-containing protein n=2 Tax=Dethiosulfovibrio TaxID=47054 RepID=A0ABS9EQI6_9BACT|nr:MULTISPECIES: cupin domain-containing protein [Dethiosulfovibrio]MCF4151910.1 cupin domain-containing protein [Dethiosulfovibrio faecalis]MEA3283775.1 cupin domain-containing protein [Synergistota bacterium]MCF4115103.1 cupin domain-containing protein [Dethiosulfovibrio russensis]MCF4143455.1 cupin domain-containing protein [Dethiosulfovibrio marinus]MCF4145730.1 cupin domain-containing protein [Dethiosulfovibrio acidaminovorans]
MGILKNLPTQEAEGLASLIEGEKNQVVSMALSESDHVHVSLFTFADREMVSEERYPGDTMYLVVEGETLIAQGERKSRLKAGEVFMVPKDVPHAVGGAEAFKVLQITMI